MARRTFKNLQDSYRLAKPLWACLKCGWFTREGKTRACPECHNGCEHFDSTGEYYYFKQLQMLEKSKVIRNLERQVTYEFYAINVQTKLPVWIFDFTADFRYVEKGVVVVADFKPSVKATAKDPSGKRGLSETFTLKKRAMRDVYGIDVKIVTSM